MNDYEQRQEARRARLERAAERAGEEARERFSGARRSVDGIPSGQPILIGHHSERRHRGALAKHDRHMRAGLDAEQRAHTLAARAEAVGTGGISSDDPEAVAKLEDKRTDLERTRDRMKAINAAYRKRDAGALASLGAPALDVLDAQVATAYSWEKQPYPKWQLANLGARIRDAAKRAGELALIPAHQAEGASEPRTFGALVVLTDPAELRVLIRSPHKLPRPAYQLVRGVGFVWSPTRTAFVRKYQPATLAGIRAAAERVAATIAQQQEDAPCATTTC
jgi:hypothetical protein